MTSAEWFVIQLLTAILAGIFAIVGAALLFVETISDNEATHNAKQRLGAALQKISASPLADLPAYILRLSTVLQQGRDRLIAWSVSDRIGGIIVGTFAGLTAIMAVAIKYGSVPLAIFMVVGFITTILVRPRFPMAIRRAAQYLSDLNAFLLAGAAAFLFIGYTISLSATHKLYSLAIAIAISPCALVVADILASFGKLESDAPAPAERADNPLYIIGAAVGLSVVATVIALILGSIAAPEMAQMAVSLQAIVANLSCDTLTLLLLIKLFASRDKADKPRGIVVTVVISLIISAVLACLSLYLSFVGTANAFRLIETLHVLVGLTPRGDKFQLSPFFFLMHTTFIPAALFLLLLLSAAGVKLIVLIAVRVLGLSKREQVNPFRAFAAMFGIFVAVFSAASGIAGIMKEGAKDRSELNPALERSAPHEPASALYIRRHMSSTE